MGSYKDKNAGAQRAQRSVRICLRGDLVADWEAANRELTRAQELRRGADSKEGGGNLSELIDKVRTLETEMQAHADEWVLRALPRHEFRALVAGHPPRLGEDGNPITEDTLGLNRDTFFPALIRASVVSPELDADDWLWLFGHTDEERAQLEAEGKADQAEDGVLTDRQFGDLEDTAWFLNRGEVNVPFSHAASLATRDSNAE